MTSTAAGAGSGSLNPPHSNPSGDGGPRIRSPPGKGNKPVALADITNTGKPNAARSITVPDLVKENTKLLTLLNEKTKIIDLSRVEIYKLRLALQASKQQNLHLTQTNSQMLAEINTGKDRIKMLQHELSCTTALLKVKDSELDRKKNAGNVQQKGVKSQVLKTKASTVAVEAHHVGDSVTSGVEHHVVESQSAVSSNTVCQEPPQDGKQKRMPQRRRSSRLNQGSCEIRGVSQNTLHENPVVPVAPSTLSLEKQYGQTTGKHMKSLQNECSATVHEVIMASEFEKTEINELPQKTDLKEIPEACSSETEVQSHKIGDKAFNSKQNHLTGSQSSLSFNTVDTPEPPEDNTVKRCSKKRSSIEDVNAKLDTITSEPLRHEEKRKSRRKISARLNSVSSEHTDIVVETEHKDVIVSLAGSTSNVSMEQRTNQEQDGDCFSRKSNENQILGRRSLRRAAEKVVSYKEMPLNVKMRRP
ncbi:shugoshin-1 isoform X1 [Zea mays]|uniref:Shugoshin 1 n=1 Tax=Zea mays TaxID=4577 RepID=A0A1D6HVU4_MAIZE|nr:shugoshin-1 isoform X1 [Zea mays]ONM52351.1 shugoshin centromeric cohesion1 [Zea mays]|eukprot:XP_008651879.1 shugoshin-1 isoform X1 [Zea mays]